MAEGKEREPQRPERPDFRVNLEYEPSEGAEDRLLRAYELLLRVPEAPEIDLEAQK